MEEKEREAEAEFPAFPYKPYSIQTDFMKALYCSLENGGVSMLESPTGMDFYSIFPIIYYKCLMGIQRNSYLHISVLYDEEELMKLTNYDFFFLIT